MPIIQTQISKSGSGSGVTSVNGQTGIVELNAKDVEAIQQYTDLPDPNADNLYDIVQYSGETNGIFTNGYFYKSIDIPIPESFDVVATPCYGDVELVNSELFQSIVNLSDGESTEFVWHVEYPDLFYSVTQGNFDINVWDPAMAAMDYPGFIENVAGEYDESYDNTYYVYAGNDQWDCFKSDDDTQFGTIQTSDFGMCGIDIMVQDELNPGDQFTLSKSGEEIQRWERDGVPVEDEGYSSPLDYGITWNGYEEENTSITVTYFEGQIEYEWQQVNVQPQPVINYPVTSVNNQTGAVNITAAGIGATTKTTKTATLYSNAWTEGTNHNKQTVSVSGVTANNIVLVAPDSTDEGVSQTAWSKSGVLCVAQSNNNLTFMYDSTKSAPVVNISINVVILN